MDSSTPTGIGTGGSDSLHSNGNCATRRYKILTLAFIMKGDQVLLGLKKRGFGKGKWNGFGGKVEPNETIPDAAAREVQEECGLTVKTEDLEQMAVIDFELVDDPVILKVHVFKCTKFTGDVVESEEMLPKWYPINEVPYEKMWSDDEVWYPLLVAGVRFKAHFLLVEEFTKIVSYKITDWENTQVLKEMLQ